MDLFLSFFSSHGRIARATWLARVVLLGLLCSAFGLLAQSVAGETGAALLAALFLWGATCVTIQRLHDIGSAGWTLVALLIPVFGALWTLMRLVQHGAEGDNRYGADPLLRADYLQVDITK